MRSSGRSATVASKLSLKRKLEEDEYRRVRVDLILLNSQSNLPRKHAKRQKRYTQEELLKIAMENEKHNLANVKQYELLEDERRKKRNFTKTRQLTGPIITYRSYKVQVDENGNPVNPDPEKEENEKPESEKKYVSKNVMTFTNFTEDPFTLWLEKPTTCMFSFLSKYLL